MYYSLKCGKCLIESYVEGLGDSIAWTCDDCGNINCSSLPVTTSGELITDYTKADAILSPLEIAQATTIIEGRVI